LETVDLAEFGNLERQVAIGLEAILEDLHVARTVHRLYRVDALVVSAVLGEEHQLAIFLHMAGRDPERRIHELWGIHLDVAGLLLAPADVILEYLEQRPALGMPEYRPGGLLLEMKQIHFAAKPAVVALLRFFDLFEMRIELFLSGKGRSINAREHFAFGI